MSDQPIPQEVDPVRGLVEALEQIKGGFFPKATTLAIAGDWHECFDQLQNIAATALASYRAWEEGGGSDSAAAPGRSGRPQEAPSPAETALLLLRMTKFRLEPRLDAMNPERGCVIGPGLAVALSEAINHGIDALANTLPRSAASAAPEEWKPIESAPKDRLIEVYAPAYEGLNAMISLCEWHEDAGFCICELRSVTHWRPHEPPTSADLSPGAALEAAGVDSADTLSDPIPSPPAGVDRPETEGEAARAREEGARDRIAACLARADDLAALMARGQCTTPAAVGRELQRLLNDIRQDALLAQQKERG